MISIGVILGLVLGKPIGITLFSWLGVRSGKAELPASVTWNQIVGASCLAGVGFTMSIFISELAFKADGIIDEASVAQAKIGVIIGSLVAGVAGFLVLRKALSTSVAHPIEGRSDLGDPSNDVGNNR